jgi:threonine-phosphate decarboxylase
MSRSYDHGGNIFDLARRMGVAPSAMADFSASINPLGLSPLVREAISATLDSLVHYPDNGHALLKQALADYHGLSPANFVVANGSTELIYQLPAVISGRRALIVSPSFSEYERALERHQWEVRHFILSPADDFKLDLARLECVLAEGFDALYLCNPGNPNGTLYPLQVIEQLYGICSASGTFLVLDEAFMDFCEGTSAKQVIANADNGLILRSMTKFHAIPGLRLGYAIAGESLAGRIDSLGVPWSVNTLALAAGLAALQDSGQSMRTVEFIDSERRYLSEQLGRFPQLRVCPSSVNFLLVEIIGGMTASELRGRLLTELIVIRDCASFTGLTPNYFRIAVRTRDENRRLVECLEYIFR